MSKRALIIAFLCFIIAIIAVWLWPTTTSPVVSFQKEEVSLIPEERTVSPVAVLVPKIQEKESGALLPTIRSTSLDKDLPEDVDLMAQLFNPYPPILSIVETVSYVSRVPWLIQRPAYLGDWAAHYETSKHFISRSIKGVATYCHEKVSRGERFNVFRKDKNIEFHLVADLSRKKLWLYYFDKEENTRQLLKTYPICVGKLSQEKRSGCLTPTGVFEVGREVAIYRQGDMGLYMSEMCEMVTIFGKRWIPLSREVAECSGSCKGLGLHGVPWEKDLETGKLVEKRDSIGTYSSLGCIRFLTEDVKEIFSIITSRRSYVHIVKDFQEAVLPGKIIQQDNLLAFYFLFIYTLLCLSY